MNKTIVAVTFAFLSSLTGIGFSFFVIIVLHMKSLWAVFYYPHLITAMTAMLFFTMTSSHTLKGGVSKIGGKRKCYTLGSAIYV